MSKYYLIKEFSELTGVTVKTLRYYDKINLLEPSKKSSSGYRLYCNETLLKLQQINTLKFLGYSLNDIKQLTDEMSTDICESLDSQAEILKQHVEQVKQALKLINQIQVEIKTTKEPDWDLFVALIGVLQLGDASEQAWQKEIFTPDEQERFNVLIRSLDSEKVSEYYRLSEVSYNDVRKYLDKNPTSDPSSQSGQAFAQQWVAMIKQTYQNEFGLGLKVWDATLSGKLPKKYLPKFYDKQVATYMRQAVRHYLKDK